MANNKVVSIENAKIAFRNFAGVAKKFNPEGSRNFCVFLDPHIALALINERWNIRFLNPRDPADDRQAYVQVKVQFDNFPPNVVMITSGGKQQLNVNTVAALDYAEIVRTDLILRPYAWNVNGKSGTKPYLKAMYVTIAEDDFGGRYKDLPDSDAPEYDAD